jgi:hypothetical protein
MNTLEEIALHLYTSHLDEKSFEGWELRKGKVTEDINKAVRRGIKMGNGKFEYQVDFISVYLKDVLKKKRPTKV